MAQQALIAERKARRPVLFPKCRHASYKKVQSHKASIMPDYYSSCGWAPFGLTKQKADNVGTCGPLTTRNDRGECVNVGTCGPFTNRNDQGECVIDASNAMTVVLFEYCRLNPTNTDVCGSVPLGTIKDLPGCEDTFLTEECGDSVLDLMHSVPPSGTLPT